MNLFIFFRIIYIKNISLNIYKIILSSYRILLIDCLFILFNYDVILYI